MSDTNTEQALNTGCESAELRIQPVNKEGLSDWHRADILAAVKKKGSTMVALSRRSGLADSTLSNVLHRPWPKGERIVSAFIGVPPEVIWPSRYRRPTGDH